MDNNIEMTAISEPLVNNPPPVNSRTYGKVLPQYGAAIAATMTFFALGLSVYVPRIIFRYHDTLMEHTEQRWIFVVPQIGAAIGAPIVGFLAYFWGRKRAILSIGGLRIIAAVIAFAFPVRSMLYLHSILFGMALGGTFVVVPVYLSEIADDNHRGSLGGLMSVMLYCGLVTGLSLEYLYIYWVTVAVTVILILLSFGATTWIPETPNFLIIKDQRRDAMRSLDFLRGTECQNELTALQASSTAMSFGDMKNLKPFFLSLGIIVFQRYMDIDRLVSYTGINISIMFPDTSTSPWITSMILLYIVVALLSLLSLLVVYFVKWKILLIISCVGTATGTSVMCACYLVSKSSSFSLPPVVFSVIGLFIVASYSIALVYLPFTIMATLLPPKFSVICTSIIICYCHLNTFAKNVVYLIHEIDPRYLFIPTIVFSIVCALFVAIIVPEMKGKSWLGMQNSAVVIHS